MALFQKSVLKSHMKDKIEIMVINFGCVDLMDPELIKKFKKQNLKEDGIERLPRKQRV